MVPYCSSVSSTLLRVLGRRNNQGLLNRLRPYSSSSNNDDDDNTKDIKDKKEVRKKTTPTPPPRTTKNPEEAKTKLNALLQSIVKDGQQAKDSSPSPSKDSDKSPSPSKSKKTIDFGLARKEKERPSPSQLLKEQEDRASVKVIGKTMLKAVKKVAESAEPGREEEVESELVKKLKTQQGKMALEDMSKLFEGMKVDKRQKKSGEDKQGYSSPAEGGGMSASEELLSSRARRVRKTLGGEGGGGFKGGRRDREQPFAMSGYRPLDLFGARPLGIFTINKDKELKDPSKAPPISYLKTWDALHKKDLKLAVTHPPANGFEEMILWTEQRKLWEFPINNEQGLEEETKSSFADHIFLEPHLDPWCPKKGPIRHFMELVCIGLSKNAYLTVDEKKDQIQWFHQYFKDKAKIIKEVGAGDIK